MEDIKDQMIEYLSRKKILTLATSNKKGEPVTHPIAYVNKDATIYFSTGKKTRKVKNMEENPTVSYSVYDETEYFDEIRSIQMEGIASIVSNKKEFDEAVKLLYKKFPSMSDLPLDAESVIVKITPKTCFFNDYVRRFGYREKIEF